MFGQIAQAVMVEMVREMKICADSGTAGTDLSRPRPMILSGRCSNGKLVFMRAHIN